MAAILYQAPSKVLLFVKNGERCIGIVNLMGMAELAPPDLKRISHLGRGRSTIISKTHQRKTIKLTIPAAVRAGDMRRCFHATLLSYLFLLARWSRILNQLVTLSHSASGTCSYLATANAVLNSFQTAPGCFPVASLN